jgi:predicted DNA-binding transcriptional regulator AlpA
MDHVVELNDPQTLEGDNPNPLYRTRQAAQYLGVSPGTLTNWRLRNCGPAHIKLGSGKYCAVRYRQSALEEFIQAGEMSRGSGVKTHKPLSQP